MKAKKGWLCGFSALLFVCGVAVLICGFGVAAVSSLSTGSSASDMDPMAMMQQTGTALLIILALGIAGLGVQGMCLSTKCANIWCIRLWGCSLCCASLLVFIFGCLFAASNSMVGGYI